MHIFEYFKEDVKIIWYEVGENEDAISLFTRLNIGKIPLTSAELVKAMFLSKDTSADMDKEKQEEISLQWDNMEKELHNDSLWYFLTNKTNNRYQTRIDLVLDLISGKKPDNREKYYTFFKFDEMRADKSLDEIWRKIQQTFLVLKDWFENHELYHKIGYLIASNTMTLQQIYEEADDKTKDAFIAILDDKIRSSIHIQDNYSELSYEEAYEIKAALYAMMVASGQYSVDEIKNMYAMDFEEEGLHIDSEYMDELIKVMSKHWRENKNREIERMAEIREKRKKGW